MDDLPLVLSFGGGGAIDWMGKRMSSEPPEEGEGVDLTPLH